jgi:hypothetical protein
MAHYILLSLFIFLGTLFFIWISYSYLTCIKHKNQENNLINSIVTDLKSIKEEIQFLKNKD